jgi:predicted amidohydrolase
MRPYKVALIQQETHVISDADIPRAEEIKNKNLSRIFELADFATARLGKISLACYSEYGVIAQYRPRSVDTWLEIAETIPGPLTERIGKKAKELGCFFSGNAFERDPLWPGRLFNTSFIVDPDGHLILKYRKQNGPNNLNTTYTGPGDVYTEYLDKHGPDSMFPVVETEIGVLGCMSCTDIIFPEVARALALKGAEVILHPTSEPYAPEHTTWDALRQARAYENLAYLLSTNAGAYYGSHRPTAGYRGHTMLVGPSGRVESIAEGSGELVVTGSIDIENLRYERTRKPGSGHVFNALVEMRADVFAPIYAAANRWPNDGWADRKLQSTDETRALASQIIDRLIAERKLIAPKDFAS